MKVKFRSNIAKVQYNINLNSWWLYSSADCLMEYASLFCSFIASRPSIEFVNAGVRRCTSVRCGAGCLWVCVSECIVEDAREGSAERGNDWSFLPFTNCEGRETSPVQDIRHLIWFLDYIAVWTTGRNILAPYDPFSLFVSFSFPTE